MKKKGNVGTHRTHHKITDLLQRIQILEKENSLLKQQAEYDGLTGCLRREALLNLLQKQQDFGVLASKVSIAILDLDHFKKINDSYGHLVGDQALRFASQHIKNELPEGSLLARVGGEEFLVVLPMHKNFAERLLNRIRDGLARESLVLEDGRNVTVTLSCGLAEWNTDHPLEQAYHRADEKLYQAKHSGRNQVAA